jgi:hypothetical protein
MQLIHIDTVLAQVEKPLKDDSRRPFAYGASGFAAVVVAFIATVMKNSPAAMVGAMLGMLIIMLLVVGGHNTGAFLPEPARRFLRETRAERRCLDRESRALNRAWCLADRHRGLLASSTDQDAPWEAKQERLTAELTAYADRYRQAVALDLVKAGARQIGSKRLARHQLRKCAHASSRSAVSTACPSSWWPARG